MHESLILIATVMAAHPQNAPKPQRGVDIGQVDGGKNALQVPLLDAHPKLDSKNRTSTQPEGSGYLSEVGICDERRESGDDDGEVVVSLVWLSPEVFYTSPHPRQGKQCSK